VLPRWGSFLPLARQRDSESRATTTSNGLGLSAPALRQAQRPVWKFPLRVLSPGNLFVTGQFSVPPKEPFGPVPSSKFRIVGDSSLHFVPFRMTVQPIPSSKFQVQRGFLVRKLTQNDTPTDYSSPLLKLHLLPAALQQRPGNGRLTQSKPAVVGGHLPMGKYLKSSPF